MTQSARSWKRWILIVLMMAWMYLASSVLQVASSEALKFTLLGGFLAVTEVLIGISIAAGELLPFALGLVFFGTLLSNIPLFDLQSLKLPPDQWKMAVALAGCAMLISSRWIQKIAERLPLFRNAKTSHSIPLPSNPKVEITVRLVYRGLSLGPRRRWVRRSNASRADEKIGNPPGGSVRSYDKQDHKLPFWVRS